MKQRSGCSIGPSLDSASSAVDVSDQQNNNRYRLRNRMLMCALAVCLMWATSLKVAVYIVSFFIDVPPFEAVVDSCKNTYEVTRDERRKFTNCVDAQVRHCDDNLAEASFHETRRVNLTTARNQDTVDAARQVQSDCSSAYTSLRYTIEAWVGAGHSIPYKHNLTCSAEDLTQLTSSVGDISAVRSEAYSASTEYSDESKATVRRLVEYAELRAAYDAEYMNNHTLRIQDQLAAFAAGIEAPKLNVDQLFGDIQADVDMLISCVSPRNIDSGECPSLMGAQERLQRLRSEMDRRLEIYAQEINSWRRNVDAYKANVQKAYNTAERFYWGVKNAIPNWFDNIALKGDWWDISASDLMAVDVNFPSATPTFRELPTLDDVWNSVSVSLEFFYLKLDSVEEKVVRLAKELGDGFERDLRLSLPNVAPSDYNPPKYKGSSGELSSMAEEELRHVEKSEAFMERTAVALDAFSELSQVDPDDDLLGNASSFFNFTSIQSKLSNVNVSFKTLIQPGIDFDLWFLRLNSFGDALFLFDLLYRVYSTIRVVYRYWSVGAVTLPKVDMRARKRSDANNVLKVPTVRLLVMILINPAMGFFFLLLSMWWLITIATSLYAPLYNEYLMGCVPAVSNGTFVTNNLFSLSYNHAYQDGSSKLLEGLEKFDMDRGQICSSRHAPSASRYHNDAAIFSSLVDTHNLTTDKMDLMKRCIDEDALGAAFQEACCDQDGYSSCSGESSTNSGNSSNNETDTCPLNDLVQPPAPFSPPIEHLAAPSCNVNMDYPSWQVEDSIFHCDMLPSCDNTCEGPDQAKLERTSRECGCTVEWFLHSLWLKVMLSLLVYALTNASRIGFVDGLARLLWRRLHTDFFTVITSCERDGTLVTKRIKRKGEQTDSDIQAYARDEIDRNMVRFQAKGLGMVACAVLANVVWIWVLANLARSSVPSWLA